MWCVNVCENDEKKTMDFINAANMKEFEGPVAHCNPQSSDKQCYPDWYQKMNPDEDGCGNKKDP